MYGCVCGVCVEVWRCECAAAWVCMRSGLGPAACVLCMARPCVSCRPHLIPRHATPPHAALTPRPTPPRHPQVKPMERNITFYFAGELPADACVANASV